MKLPRTTFLCVLVGALAVGLGLVWYSANRPTSFDQAVWLGGEKAGFSSDAPRLRMADGLLASRILEGKSRAEVESMLGSPTRTNKFRDFDLVYWLGAERGFISIDSEWLVIRFDAGNSVNMVSIVRD